MDSRGEHLFMKMITIRSCVKVAALVACVLHVQGSWSASFSLNPGADAFVTTGSSGDLSHDNYGAAGALSLAAPGLPSGEFQSVLQFGLAGAKNAFDAQFGAGQWSVQSVKLQLTTASPKNLIFNANAAGQFGVSLMLNNSWTEGSGTPLAPTTTGITFSTLPNFESAMDEAVGSFSYDGGLGATTYNLTLTPTLLADIQNGNTASLRMFAEDQAVSYLFFGDRFGTVSSRPLLTIGAIPEPGVCALGLVGLGLLAWSRRTACGDGRDPNELATKEHRNTKGILKTWIAGE
jgi:hypothetical protein